MKIKTIKKWCCNAMSGGVLAILPMFFLFSVAGTELNAQQVDRPYSEATVISSIETLKGEAIKLKEEIGNLGGGDEDYLLLDYYAAIINELRSGATLEDAFLNSLIEFFVSPHSNQRSDLHLAIFGMPQFSTPPTGGDPANAEFSSTASGSHYQGEVEEEFKQLVVAIDDSEGHPSAFNAMFNFLNNNK